MRYTSRVHQAKPVCLEVVWLPFLIMSPAVNLDSQHLTIRMTLLG